MAEIQKSDAEIVAEERCRWRAHSRTIIWTFLFWLAVALLMVAAFNSGIPQMIRAWAGIPDIVVVWIPLIFLLFLWRILLLYRKRFSPLPESLRPSVQKRLVDDYTRRQRFILVAFIPLTLLLTLNSPETHGSSSDASWFSLGAFVSYMLLAALMIVFGPGFLNTRFRAANQDEASRMLRVRSTAVGYIAAMIAMTADYGIGLFAPTLLQAAIPLSLAAAFIVPALYYVIADWRASLTKEDRDG